MKTLKDVLKLSAQHLIDHSVQNADREAECILMDALNLKRMDLYMQFDRPFNENELALCREALKRRVKGEPLAYIFSKKEFYNREFFVSPSVLIPRQETELLVDRVVSDIKEFQKSGLQIENLHIWDLCCGSGCMGLTVKAEFPQCRVTLSDISTDALEVAKKNAENLALDVSFVKGDFLHALSGSKCHILLCNPPYIAQKDFESLENDVKDFEPYIALISGESGLEFYEKLAKGLSPVLFEGGRAYIELGSGQGDAVLSLFSAPEWKNYWVEKDYANHDRFFFLEKEGNFL